MARSDRLRSSRYLERILEIEETWTWCAPTVLGTPRCGCGCRTETRAYEKQRGTSLACRSTPRPREHGLGAPWCGRPPNRWLGRDIAAIRGVGGSGPARLIHRLASDRQEGRCAS